MRTPRLLTIVLLASSLTAFTPACGPSPSDDDGGTNTDTDGGGQTGPEGVNHPGTCDDGVDNDGNGFMDCDDFACDTDPVCEAPASLSIKDIQDESSQFHPQLEDTVHLSGVIVTAVKPRTAGSQTFYDAHIQMPEGGAYSGIALRGSPEEIKIGDSLTVEGTYTEYFDFSQVLATSVTVESSNNPVPAPEVVPAADLATGSAEAEKWEGVLVQVNDVEVIEPEVLGTDGNEHGDFEITDGLIVGNTYWHDYGDDVQTAGDQFQSIAGVMQYSYSEFRLQPRNNEDITFADGTHPGPGEAVELPIQAIQDESHADHPEVGSAVSIVDAVVTAVEPKDAGGVRSFVIQQGTGTFSGVWVYVPAFVTVESLAIGDTVSIKGEYTEYYDMTEISLMEAPVVGAAGTVPEPELITDPQTLIDAATAEPYEGVLVKLQPAQPMTVDSAADSNGIWVVDGVNVDDVYYDHPAAAGQTVNSVTGIFDYTFQKYHILPRSADDVDAGEAPPATEVTIQSIQDTAAADHPAEGTALKVVDAVVTAVKPGTQSAVAAFAMQQGTGQQSGIWVYVPMSAAPAALAVGDTVTVEGTYEERFENTQISATSITVGAAGSAPAPEVLEPTVIADAATAEAWEGVLVTLQMASGDLTVATAPDQYGVWNVEGVDVDDDLYAADPAPAAGDTFQSLTGIVYFSYGTFKILPRDASDIVQ